VRPAFSRSRRYDAKCSPPHIVHDGCEPHTSVRRATLADESPRLDFPKVIDLLAEFFEREKLPFAVIGAFGLHAYGLTRATTDLDFVTDSAAQPRVVAFLERSGYETLYVSPGYSNHLHPDADLGRVDLVYVSGETSRRLFAESKSLRIAGRVLPVPRPEVLAAMKVHAMRNDPERRHQDLSDIRFLLGLSNVDREEIRAYFEAGGMGELYDDLEETV